MKRKRFGRTLKKYLERLFVYYCQKRLLLSFRAGEGYVDLHGGRIYRQAKTNYQEKKRGVEIREKVYQNSSTNFKEDNVAERIVVI